MIICIGTLSDVCVCSGTPTSTTTSLSALSTTAIKDGHRGHPQAPNFGGRGHHHHQSTNSLEAERADRISRLAGLERVSTLRAHVNQQNQNSGSPQTTPTSTGIPTAQQQQIANLPNAPAYFDSNGQPTAVTKMSTVGTASATGSVGARTTTEAGEQFDDHAGDEDMMSLDTNYRTMDVDSTSGDPMDEDMTSRSVGGFEDRMSDDGTASLVGFGEGANSTVSGPIYHRRPLPGAAGVAGHWGLERSSSGLSEGAMLRAQQLRETAETQTSASAQAERREARMRDGVSMDGSGHVGTTDDDMYVDTTNRGPVPVHPGQHFAPGHQQQQGSTSREAAERIIRERLEGGEGRVSSAGPAQ